ncbi:hypothetical protein ES703_76685 [subsurface metagenome]
MVTGNRNLKGIGRALYLVDPTFYNTLPLKRY